MKNKLIFPAFVLFCSQFLSAQEKEIDTVFIFDKKLSEAKKTQQVYEISQTDIKKNPTNLSEVLRFQSPVYIKENGRGASSSPSFRGTTAQQTAFVWNGIPVNSIFLGQGDVNNFSVLSFDHISVKAGGGSVEYGSSAIGGTIHLNNSVSFDKGFHGKIFAEYGSFETFNSSLKTSYSNEKFVAIFSTGNSKSNNEYHVPERNFTNTNGEYNNQNFNLSAGYRFNEKNQIYLHTQQFFGDQHFPVFDVSQTRTKYETSNFRSILSWDYSENSFKNQFSTAFLEEVFSYFAKLDAPRQSGGVGKSLFFKDDFSYFFNQNFKLSFYALAKKETGEGYNSGIQNAQRWSGSVAALFKYDSEKLYLEAGAKKELVEKKQAPFLYSLGGQLKFSPMFLMKFKGSKNFRFPSFNDLYWQPGGNPDLKPEISYQGEITPQLSFKNFKIFSTAYLNQIKDMIRWIPTPKGFWAPENVDKVKILGIESQLSYRKNFGEHHFDVSLGYAFTKSENQETGFQLSYVPLHKAFGMLNYRYKPLEFFFQGTYNGITYTTTDESNADAIKPYFVANAGIYFTVLKNQQIGFKVNNIFDQVYETTRYYPLPKRNYSASLSINF